MAFCRVGRVRREAGCSLSPIFVCASKGVFTNLVEFFSEPFQMVS